MKFNAMKICKPQYRWIGKTKIVIHQTTKSTKQQRDVGPRPTIPQLYHSTTCFTPGASKVKKQNKETLIRQAGTFSNSTQSSRRERDTLHRE